MQRRLGSGHFGEVFLANKGGKSFAIKKVVNTERNTAQQEIKILKQVDHPNIVKLIDVYEDESTFSLVLELMSGGEVS